MVTDAGYYEWSSAAGGISVLLRLDVVDRMLPGILTAFGAVPKRGAEAGGILLGTLEGATIRIDDFEAVPCSYRRGPSYLLAEPDLAAFEAAVRSKGRQAVGYYRSHTREPQAISEEDRALCARFFPPPHGVALIVRPYATRPCTAGFLAYQDGKLPDWPAEQFPLRRRQIEGGEPPAPAVPAHAVPLGFSLGGYVPAPASAATPSPAPPVKTGRSKSWIWACVSFLALLIGTGAGFLVRSTLLTDAESRGDPFAVSLSAKLSDDDLLIHWDRNAPAVRYATSGTLQIIDGPYTKTVDLSASELQNGTIIFHTASDAVSIRLEIVVRENSKVVDTTAWTRPGPR